MKRAFFIAMLALLMGTTLFAQEHSCKVDGDAFREKILKKKMAIYTERLKLTKEESDKFWAVYKEYDEAIFRQRDRQREVREKLKGRDVLDVETALANEFIATNLEADREINRLENKYMEIFKTILPPRKVAKLMCEERKIMHEISREARHRDKCEDKAHKKSN